MEYRDIIKLNIEEATKRRDKEPDRKQYWEWIINQLMADLNDYEGKERWTREPYDQAFVKYRRNVMDVDEIIRRFFEGDFGRI